MPLLQKLLQTHLTNIPFKEPELVVPPVKTLTEKIAFAIDNFDFDILFIHRDAENQDRQKRIEEITQAAPQGQHPVVCVIPVKMTEAWLLTSEAVIRQAVGNPTSKAKLALPSLKKIESCEAKFVLNQALIAATEWGTQRRRKFNPEQYRYRVAELTTNLQALRQIRSFQLLENDLVDLLKQLKIPHADV